mmetsp:Transcript_19842/g.55317  ORF Transcript_19842/g.55317 Transcript_19842/m.55317 type:complete len:242 (+) Transcript_19842:108-833(+)
MIARLAGTKQKDSNDHKTRRIEINSRNKLTYRTRTEMMNKTEGLLTLALVSIAYIDTSDAFIAHRHAPTVSKIFDVNNPFREVDINIDFAEDCVNNFGKYSFEELEHARDELHAHRVQSVALGEGTNPDIIKERFLETELTMQLDRLKDEFPESYLFPEDEEFDFDIAIDDVGFDFVMMDNGLKAMDLPDLNKENASSVQTTRETKASVKAWKDIIASEGVLESIAICGMLGLMMMAPSLM